MPFNRTLVYRAWSGILLVVAFCAGCSDINWERDYDKGMQRAIQQQRRVLLQFYSPMCSDCRRMDDEVLSDPDVQRVLARYLPIRVDMMFNRRLAEQMNVVLTPTFVVMRPERTGMNVIASRSGFSDKEEFRLFLIKNALY
ncbi:MAG: thioredoxin family protein [Phycisphaerales bacterium]|nr:thioredoxin family protein [Phycisphaerales bacterium]